MPVEVGAVLGEDDCRVELALFFARENGAHFGVVEHLEVVPLQTELVERFW